MSGAASHVKVWAEPCEAVPGRWQVVATRGDKPDSTFLLESCLSRAAALKVVRLAERTALFAGAVVVA